MYDWEGVCTTSPFYLYAVDKAGVKTLITEFDGLYYDSYVGPYPERFVVCKEICDHLYF